MWTWIAISIATTLLVVIAAVGPYIGLYGDTGEERGKKK